MLNIAITGLMPRHQTPVSIGEEDMREMYLIAETHKKVVHIVHFNNLIARNNFFRGKIELSPRSRVWINEDLTMLKEFLARSLEVLGQQDL